jgi:hypothetical protein
LAPGQGFFVALELQLRLAHTLKARRRRPWPSSAASNHQREGTTFMAGTIRKRSWKTRKGEVKSAWVADYSDQNGNRHLKTFETKKAADAWLLKARSEVRDGTHTPDSASLTIAEAGKLYLERCATEGLERGSRRAYS